MSRFVLHTTPISGLRVVERRPIGDSRGFLERLYCQETFEEITQGKAIRQINRTLTRKRGTVRGLHFQYPPYAETKVVTCLKGKVWDVAVDLRRYSPTFLRYHAVLLSDDNRKSYLIPEGFAHGFQALAPDCEMLYLHTANYDAETEGAVNALDARLGITWPEQVTERSERDKSHAMLTDDFDGIPV